ncbi:MAG TPA: ParB/RepB/Spo0J family partition protein [Tepidiformaceae bacterium]|nr:ParB/RepB/Spo0J family partition protein [Tepidiformaceae bacterium]
MTQPKRGLGRGLDALFGGPAAPAAEPEPAPERHEPEPPAERPAAPPVARREPEPEPYERRPVAVQPAPAAPVVPTRSRGPEHLDIDLIAPNPEQPRTNFEPEKLRELSESIREHGIIQPLVVSRDDDGGYFLIAGERRLQAARLAGLDTVPVVVRQAADRELLELALIENIQRADLNAVEEAMAYRRLVEEYAMTQEEVARRVGKNRATIANALRLLQLESEIRRSLVAGEITEGHARALLGLPEGRGRVNAWREVVKRKLSVRDTEGYVRRQLAEAPATTTSAGAQTARRDSAYGDIESRLRRALSTRVKVEPQKKGAKIVIECYSDEEFENVVSSLLGEYQ